MKTAKIAFSLLAALVLPSAADDLPPDEAFRIHCSACHAVDRGLVGPSLVEIAGIYRNDVEGFIRWSIEPERKREGAIEMPSMAHVGKPTLRKLHGYILDAAEGKTELETIGGDPFGVPSELVRRPQVQRMFLPDASPAAIAVALPGELSYCFDAGECRLRYVWKGGFIDAYPYWKGNGSQMAKIDGDVIHRESQFPLQWGGEADGNGEGDEAEPEFLGYSLGDDGLPTFRYRRDGITIEETVRPLSEIDGPGVSRTFVLTPAPQNPVTLADAAELESAELATAETPVDSITITLTQFWK